MSSITVEDCLYQRAAVAEAAVIGVPHETWGEPVLAFVVLRPSNPATVGEPIAHCRSRLSHFKCPTRFPAPRSASSRSAACASRTGPAATATWAGSGLGGVVPELNQSAVDGGVQLPSKNGDCDTKKVAHEVRQAAPRRTVLETETDHYRYGKPYDRKDPPGPARNMDLKNMPCSASASSFITRTGAVSQKQKLSQLPKGSGWRAIQS